MDLEDKGKQELTLSVQASPDLLLRLNKAAFKVQGVCKKRVQGIFEFKAGRLAALGGFVRSGLFWGGSKMRKLYFAPEKIFFPMSCYAMVLKCILQEDQKVRKGRAMSFARSFSFVSLIFQENNFGCEAAPTYLLYFACRLWHLVISSWNCLRPGS